MNKLKPSDLLVFGAFGYVTGSLSGQTVKTRSIHKLLEENLSANVPFYDTEQFQKNWLSLLNFLFTLFRIKELIYLPAGNNLKYIFPFVYVFSKIFRFNINYFVIGGWLPNIIIKRPGLRKKLSKIKGIYVETDTMYNKLINDHKLSNVFWFPNFRYNKKIKKKRVENDKLKLIFLSRINKKKGIEMVMQFAEATPLNVSIDFFGPINPEDRIYFEQNLQICKNINYKGVLEPEHIHETLSNYDILLLPTQYFTEGLPGAIVDSYFAGIPVIVTKWQSAQEFVDNGVTGFIIPFENGYEKFKEYIELIYFNRVFLNKLKQNAFKYSYRFTSDKAWEILAKTIMNR